MKKFRITERALGSNPSPTSYKYKTSVMATNANNALREAYDNGKISDRELSVAQEIS